MRPRAVSSCSTCGAARVVDTHPALGREASHEELTLAILEPEHPTAAVYLDQRWSQRARRGVERRVDVEAEPATTGAGERDVARHADGQWCRGRLVVRKLAERVTDFVTGRDALADRARQAGP